MPIQFSLVDDDEGLRQSLPLSLRSCSDLACVGCYASGAEALTGISRTPGDVVLMDIRMPGMSGIECARRLHTVLPKLPIVMLTGFADQTMIYQALAAGAVGYLNKPFRRDECAEAMCKAVHGEAPLCREASQAVLSAFRGTNVDDSVDGLSQRERDLLVCLFEKLADKEIAERMKIRSSSVRTHMRRLFAKLKVHTRAEAVSKYLSGQTSF